jgi:hypothetical protein
MISDGTRRLLLLDEGDAADPVQVTQAHEDTGKGFAARLRPSAAIFRLPSSISRRGWARKACAADRSSRLRRPAA